MEKRPVELHSAAMSSPSPEAPSSTSAYRPLPEGPSPRWRRAADGLRLVRLATWVQFFGRTIAGLVVTIGVLSGTGAGRLIPIASAGNLVALAASVAVVVGLFRFGDAPPSVGVTEPARRALAAAFGTLTTVLPGFLVGAGLHRWLNSSMLGAIATFQQLAGFGLTVAYLALLRRALAVTVQALGGSWPTWTERLVPAYVAWRIVVTISQVGVRMFLGGTVGVAWALVTLAVDAAFVLAFARLMRLAEDSLARQEATESALVR